MNVAEMIEWLKTQDQEAIVQVVMHERGTTCYDQGGNAYIEYFDSWRESMWEYQDFRHMTPKSVCDWRGNSYLLLGQIDG